MLNFKIQGFDRKVVPDKKNPDNYNMHEVVEFWLFAKNSIEAIKKARSIIKKKFYRISRVDEHIHTDPWAYFPWDKVKKLLK